MLHEVQKSLPVKLIMVPRDEIETCTSSDTARDVRSRNEGKFFSHFPVVDEGGQIIGLYGAEHGCGQKASDGEIGTDFCPLKEGDLVGADTSIIEFIREADKRPTKLVVSGDEIAGLVSLYDMQKLPARISLFAAVTALEMTMVDVINQRWPNPEGWMCLLDGGRRKNFQDAIDKAQREDSYVSEIDLTLLRDKFDVVSKGCLLKGDDKKQMQNGRKAIIKLRNDLCHPKESFADTPEKAKAVCGTVKCIEQIMECLRQCR